jgi:hypothetical protein
LLPLLLVALGLALALPGAARAAPPEHFRGEFAFTDTIPAEECGFAIQISGAGTFHDTFRYRNGAGTDVNGDRIPYAVTTHVNERGTYTANGKTLEYSVSANFQDRAITYLGAVDVIDPVSGATIQGARYRLDHYEKGVPIKIALPNGRRITVDAGNLVFEGVEIVRFYDANGELRVDLLVDGEITIHGPHPLFQSDRFCEVMNQYLAP